MVSVVLSIALTIGDRSDLIISPTIRQVIDSMSERFSCIARDMDRLRPRAATPSRPRLQPLSLNEETLDLD